ncbi:MAG TPA: helix-turn-helix transcriptional regulator [Gemmatimonadaceae bacterium]|jgi:transcriptional regulator with XRE-family HTH domain|nr:helix-turn-helix transcriptional regulator [Gemmatimonadaceae bacterium]
MGTPPRRGPSPVYRPVYRHILKKLIHARRLSGLSQAEVADALGRAPTQISRTELGERRLDPVDLQEFAILYGKPLSYFLASDTAILKANKALNLYRKMTFK